jgi:dihydrofolate synthase/folylpolyglutamate synthase
VLRRGRVTVLGALPAPARRAVFAAARRRGARLVKARFVARRASLPGAHQIGNLGVALHVLEAARRAGLRFDLRKARRGVGRAVWPGRLQRIGGRPRFLLDGAHNPAGARALAEYLRDQQPFVLVFGAMRDKNVRAMAKTLFPLAEHVVLTRAGLRRAAAPSEIARRAGALGRRAILGGSPPRALAHARALAGPRGLVVVAGSLYVVGAALELLGRGTRRRARP